MKLNYRDKIILGVLLAFVILLGGFFLLIKPRYTDIKDNRAALALAEQEKAEVDAKIAEIKPLKEEIKATYDNTTKLTNDFVAYNDIFNARKVDQYMQHFAEDCEVKVMTLNASDLSSSALSYYYFTPGVADDDMLAQADINGDRRAANTEKAAESTALKDRQKENVLTASYSINVTGSKENIWKYLQALEEQDKTIIINSVTLNDIIINPDAFEKYARALGLELTDDQKAQIEDDSEAKATFNVTLYSVYDLSEPNLEAD